MLTILSPVLKFAGISCPMDARVGVIPAADSPKTIMAGVISGMTGVRANVSVVVSERR
jgi:hypothetical protein